MRCQLKTPMRETTLREHRSELTQDKFHIKARSAPRHMALGHDGFFEARLRSTGRHGSCSTRSLNSADLGAGVADHRVVQGDPTGGWNAEFGQYRARDCAAAGTPSRHKAAPS